MAKKFVRGITDIKTINKQDLDTNNVNDLLSDGKHNYIHRKKSDGSEEYHNLTNNIKTIESSNTSLLSVTNYNNTTNSARLTPKHDRRKEQLLESTDETILISHGENGTDETTNVDVNPEIVLEHDNLLTDYGITKTTSGNTSKLAIDYTQVSEGFDLNTLTKGLVKGINLTNAPTTGMYFVEGFTNGNYTIQKAVKINDVHNTTYLRRKAGDVWNVWRQQVGDKSVIDENIAQKEQLLESTDETILISHGENGTDETTNVDVNPAKVLEHDNLVSNSDYVTIEHEEGSNTSVISTDKLESELEIVGLRNYVLGSGTAKSATDGFLYNLSTNLDDVAEGEPFIIDFDWSVTEPTETSKFRINRVIEFSDGTDYQWNNTILEDGHSTDLSTASGSGHYCGIFFMIPYFSTAVSSRYLHLNQTVSSGTVTISNLSIRRGSLKSDWISAPEDNQIVSNSSIGLVGTGLMQLYSHQMSYSNPMEGALNTYGKTVQKDTSLTNTPKIEYHFTAKIKPSVSSITITLNNNDTTYFTSVLNNYGQTSGSTKTAMINGLIFSLSGSDLTITRDDNTTYNQVVSFCDIIEPSQDTTQ